MSHSSNCNCALQGNASAFSQSLSEFEFSRSIHQAVIEGNLDRVGYLLKQSNDRVNQPDDAGYTPLLYACGIRGESLEMVKLLVESGACVNVATRHTLHTALMRACNGKVCGIAEYLIGKGAITSSQDVDGQTAADRVSSNTHWSKEEKDRILSLL